MHDSVLTCRLHRITITFSIADLASMENNMMEEDEAMGDEDGELLGSQQEAAEEGIEEAEDADGEPGETSVTCRLSIVIEKPGQEGALNIEASAQDGSILVENMFYYKDAATAIAQSSNVDALHKGGSVYPGPPFGTLDEDLQVLTEQYLEERGINSALAVFVPDYMDMKEHREYLAWLKKVKAFVDA